MPVQDPGELSAGAQPRHPLNWWRMKGGRHGSQPVARIDEIAEASLSPARAKAPSDSGVMEHMRGREKRHRQSDFSPHEPEETTNKQREKRKRAKAQPIQLPPSLALACCVAARNELASPIVEGALRLG